MIGETNNEWMSHKLQLSSVNIVLNSFAANQMSRFHGKKVQLKFCDKK